MKSYTLLFNPSVADAAHATNHA